MGYVKYVNQTASNKVIELYHQARSSGSAPGGYCKVQILGDERTGKTSLSKKLMGKPFDPEEPSTFGIDTKICRVTEVDKSWQERTKGKGDDIADCVIWSFKNRQADKCQRSYQNNVFYLALGLCLIIPLIVFPRFVILIGWSNCMKFVVCISMVTLFWTKNVHMYITIKNLAEALFTFNLAAGLLFAQNHPVPKFALGIVGFILTMQKGIITVLQIRMGISVVVGITLLLYTSDNDANFLPILAEQFSTFTLLALCVVGVIGKIGYLYFSTVLVQSNTPIISRYSLIPLEIFMEALIVTIMTLIPLLHESPMLDVGIVLFCAGLGDEFGITIGQRFTISKYFISTIMKNRILWSIPAAAYGWLLVQICHDSVSPDANSIVFNILFGVLPLVLAEWYRNHLLEYSSAALNVALKAEESSEDTMPLNISLWDFAGQELYYNTHHTFMSTHAVYVIVFNLVNLITDHNKQMERIQFWINSVRQHTDSFVLLVGTHKDCIDDEILTDSDHYLRREISDSSNVVFNKQTCFFAVDNTKPICKEIVNDDIVILQEKIHEEVLKVKHVSEDYPIKWREFYEFITNTRLKSTSLLFITISELRPMITKYHIKDMKELKEVLVFFHENGDIIYDPVDSVLRQFVFLNPQVIINIMQTLVVIPDSYETSRFRSLWRKFDRTGIMDSSLLEHIISSKLHATSAKCNRIDVIISVLQAKDLICRVECSNNQGMAKEMFVVPSKLPPGPDLSQMNVTWNKLYFIDFCGILPDAVFFRLMCRCVLFSDIVSCGPEDCMLFKEGGIFTLGANFLFMLRKIHPCKEQHVIEVSVKAVHAGCTLDVLKYLCRILETLRCRDFSNLRYHAGPLCLYKGPHQGCTESGMLHILDLNPELENELPVRDIFRQCNGRPIYIDPEEVDMLLTSEDEGTENSTLNIQGKRRFVATRSNAQVSRYKEKATESDFMDIIQILRPDDLKKLFYALDVKPRRIEISDKYSPDEDIIAVQILKKWKENTGNKATRGLILEALRRCDNVEAEEELSEKWTEIDTLATSDFFNVVELLLSYDLMKLLTTLGIQENYIQELKRGQVDNNEDMRAMEVFRAWRKANGSRATRRVILDALRRCNNVDAEEELVEKWREKDRIGLSENVPEFGIDIYISFNQRDEVWILENLVRVLSETPHYFTIGLNKYDTASHSDPLHHIRARQHNAKRIQSCKVFIAVCSRYYNGDKTGRLKFEREVARRCNVSTIVVLKYVSDSGVSDLFDAESVSFVSKSLTGKDSVGDSQDALLQKVHRIINS